MHEKNLQKKSGIITALAIMIAVAGYINYSDNHLGIDKTLKKDADTAETSASDTDAITEEIESLDYDITDESAL